jgi:hypothetical protein
MASPPGAGRSPSAPPPPKVTPPSPNRQTRDPRARPPLPPRALALRALHWVLLLGGLVVIADLGTQVIEQRLNDQEAINSLIVADFVVNIVLFTMMGAIIARESGLTFLGIVAATLAGLLASLVDGLVVVLAASFAPPRADPLPVQQYLLENIAIGTLATGLSAVVITLIDRSLGQRSR